MTKKKKKTAMEEMRENAAKAANEVSDGKPKRVELEGDTSDTSRVISDDSKKQVIEESDEPSEALIPTGAKLENFEGSEEVDVVLPVEFDSIPDLQFERMLFEEGINVTFRKGPKWSQFGIRRGDVIYISETGNSKNRASVVVRNIAGPRFLQNFTDATIAKDHDRSCRTRDGLVRELKRVYGSFDPEKDIVTMIEFVYRHGY